MAGPFLQYLLKLAFLINTIIFAFIFFIPTSALSPHPTSRDGEPEPVSVLYWIFLSLITFSFVMNLVCYKFFPEKKQTIADPVGQEPKMPGSWVDVYLDDLLPPSPSPCTKEEIDPEHPESTIIWDGSVSDSDSEHSEPSSPASETPALAETTALRPRPLQSIAADQPQHSIHRKRLSATEKLLLAHARGEIPDEVLNHKWAELKARKLSVSTVGSAQDDQSPRTGTFPPPLSPATRIERSENYVAQVYQARVQALRADLQAGRITPKACEEGLKELRGTQFINMRRKSSLLSKHGE